MTMNLSDLFWFFIVISALQPMLRKRMLDASRARLMAAIETKRRSRVILLIHRQETMAILGFPIMRYIDVHDAEDVIRAIRLTDPEVPLDLILHTPGGLVLAAVQIALAIHKRKGKVTVFVPHYAMSGGTLLALAADEIVMGEHSVLGPVDPQLGPHPAASLLKVVKKKPVAEIDDETLIQADLAEKAIQQVRETVKVLLTKHLPAEKAEELAKLLATGTWTHDYPITYEAAKKLGLNVSSEMPSEIYDLMTLFPQPVRQAQTVEYLPGPHRFERPDGPKG